MQERAHKVEHDKSLVQILDPETCALIRDPVCFSKNKFSFLKKESVLNYINLKERKLAWSIPCSNINIESIIGFPNLVFEPPSDKRINFINTSFETLYKAFPEICGFIFDFTSTICWLSFKSEGMLGNAAYYEIPHCTFFSDFGFFSIPPKTVIPRVSGCYAVLENLYHEALHHQMHSFSALCTDGYLLEPSVTKLRFCLDWRDRDFTLLESLHALHVYSTITPMRVKYFNLISNEIEQSSWLRDAISDGVRMWDELAAIVMMHQHYFKKQWQVLINLWIADLDYIKGTVGQLLEEFDEHY